MLGSAPSQKRYIRNANISSVNAENKQHLKISIVENVSRACKNIYRKYKLCVSCSECPLPACHPLTERIGCVHFHYIVA